MSFKKSRRRLETTEAKLIFHDKHKRRSEEENFHFTLKEKKFIAPTK
jgi:hypothetical protein